MPSWFSVVSIVLIFFASFVQTHPNRPYHRASTNPFDGDDSLTESMKSPPTPTKLSSTHRANEEQMKQFTRLLYERLNLNELPNVTIDSHDGTGIPSIVKFEKEQIQQNEEIHAYQQQHREETQPTTERAILPGESILHLNCQRQIAAKFPLKKDSLNQIDCFRFTKSTTESKSLPNNQIIKHLRIYVKKNYFLFNQEHEGILKPNMFQIFQVYRPTSNDTHQNPLPGFTDTIRLAISEVKQFNHNWFELTIDANHGLVSLQKIYQQFMAPWYGLAINHVLQSSRSNFYRRFYSKKHLASFLRSNDDDDDDDDDDDSKESQPQLPYMLVEYGEKIPSLSTRNRATRHTVRATPARPCDPKSPCCRRPLTIDLDQGSNALNFVIYPRQLDIGECVGLCGFSPSSSAYIGAKNDQNKNQNDGAYQVMRLHSNAFSHNRSTTTAQMNKPDQQSVHCCSYARTGGLEMMYTTRNGGPIIRKFLPNMVVEECRCGLPATIQQI